MPWRKSRRRPSIFKQLPRKIYEVRNTIVNTFISLLFGLQRHFSFSRFAALLLWYFPDWRYFPVWWLVAIIIEKARHFAFRSSMARSILTMRYRRTSHLPRDFDHLLWGMTVRSPSSMSRHQHFSRTMTSFFSMTARYTLSGQRAAERFKSLLSASF